MKGIIIDFNNEEKKGLILGNDGNRYKFNYEAEWKNKNKIPKIDDEVDFIIKDNIATEIFSLNKKSNIILEENQANSEFKRIDFNLIENEFNNIDKIDNQKKKNRDC